MLRALFGEDLGLDKRSIAATLAAGVGIGALIAVLLGTGGANLRFLSPFVGFRLFGAGILPGAVVAILLGVIGLVRTRISTGLVGRNRAVLGIAIGACLLAGLGFALRGSGGAPLLHDVSTDIESPPGFPGFVAEAEGRANGVVYPDGGPEVPKLQQEAYPDIQPIEVPLEDLDAFERAADVVEAFGWKVTLSRKSGGRIIAEVESGLFHFIDDVSIRVTGINYEKSIVDIRSNSRVGQGDMGANAARIREFREALLNPTSAP